jgi:dienelactone hydrolase
LPSAGRGRTALCALLLGVLAGLLTAATPHGGPPGLRLPAPTGPLAVGTTQLHLVDQARTDPWVPTAGARQLMVTLWYPAWPDDTRPPAPWMSGLAARHYRDRIAGPDGAPGSLPALPMTHSRLDAAASGARAGWPLILYSPGYAEDRTSATALTEDLASHGYVVAAVDHTYDAAEVEFPGPRLVRREQPDPTEPELIRSTGIRAADLRFVLDQLTRLAQGDSPDQLPEGLAGALDPARVGVFGHSLGGATAAEAMTEDRRFRAGVNLDGTLHGPAVGAGLTAPFLTLARQGRGHRTEPTWAAFRNRLTGWHAEVQLTGCGHYAFTDSLTLLPQLADPLGLTGDEVARLNGTVDPGRGTAVQRAYLTAFFDFGLRSGDRRALDELPRRFDDAVAVD